MIKVCNNIKFCQSIAEAARDVYNVQQHSLNSTGLSSGLRTGLSSGLSCPNLHQYVLIVADVQQFCFQPSGVAAHVQTNVDSISEVNMTFMMLFLLSHYLINPDFRLQTKE